MLCLVLDKGEHKVDNFLGYLTETSSNAMLGYHGPSCYAVRLDKKRKKILIGKLDVFFLDVPLGVKFWWEHLSGTGSRHA